MPVEAIQTQLRCKLCASPNRAEIDTWIEKRAMRAKDEEGNAVNLTYVQVELTRLGIENPTKENISVHWKKHCAYVSEEELAARASEVEDLVGQLNDGSIEFADADAALDWIITQGVTEAKVKLESAGKVGITVDQILKAIDSKTRRRNNEAQDELLRGLGGALAGWGRAVAGGEPQKAIEAEIVDVEAVEVEG